MIKYFEISTGTPPLHLAESTTREGVEIISWLSSEFYKGENAVGSVLYTPQSLTPEQQSQSRINIGLGNADNTADINKPISNATQQALNGKQNTLTLTTLANGNIRIGNLAGQTKDFMPATPSGDPMHYAYIANYSGLSYNPTTGLWSYMEGNGGLADLTTSEVRVIFEMSGSGQQFGGNCVGLFFNAQIRTNFATSKWYSAGWGYSEVDVTAMFALSTIEVVRLPGDSCQPNYAALMFYRATKCRRIMQPINLRYCTNTNQMFTGAYALEEVRLTELKENISFEDSPNLLNPYILYMIENAGTATFTMTLHAIAYARAMADADIQAALAVKTNVTLASASA